MFFYTSEKNICKAEMRKQDYFLSLTGYVSWVTYVAEVGQCLSSLLSSVEKEKGTVSLSPPHCDEQSLHHLVVLYC